MNLHDQMQRAVADAEPDLDRLGRVARVQGTRLRRRRQGLTVLGSVAAVSVLAVGVALSVGGDQPTDGRTPVAGGPTSLQPTSPQPDPKTSSAPGEPDLSQTGPLTGRGATAALAHAVQGVAEGTAGGFRGQGAHGDTYSELVWADGGPGVSVIGLNVQPGTDFVSSCDQWVVECSSRTVDGGRLTTFEEHTPVEGGVGVRRVADLLRADGTRIVVSSTNGHDLPANEWDVTRPQPALTTEQLVMIASQPWWGADLPTYFLEQGERLAPYEDLDAGRDTEPVTP